MTTAPDSTERAQRKEWTNWWRLAFSRNADPAIRRRAWKVILLSEAGFVVVSVVLHIVIPPLSWLGVSILWTIAILFTATLIWWVRHTYR